MPIIPQNRRKASHPSNGHTTREQINAALRRVQGRPIGGDEPCNNPELLNRIARFEQLMGRAQPIPDEWTISGEQQTTGAPDWMKPIDADELIRQHPEQRPVLIEGLNRVGETMNVISAPKIGKSWLAMGLALCVANGKRWLGKYQCRQGKVLLIDNELFRDELSFRLRKVAEAMKLSTRNVKLIPARGEGLTYNNLRQWANECIGHGQYVMIIIDSHYRMLEGVDENVNSGVTNVYNLIDRIGAQTGASVVPIHHQSQGDQSRKESWEVGSGASAQARAADCHLVLRYHRIVKDAYVLDAAVRSFPPVEPVTMCWSWPVWRYDSQIAPKLASPNDRRNGRERESTDAEVLECLRTHSALTENKLAEKLSSGKTKVRAAVARLLKKGEIEQFKKPVNGRRRDVYSVKT